jgi:ribosomal-protein-alanine N-acetyltransferase
MDDLKIRTLKSNETELIEKLSVTEREIFQDGGFNRFTIPMFASWGKYFLFENNDGIVAATQIIKSYDENSAAYIAGFWVQKNYRSKGIGSKFLINVIKLLAKDCIEKIYLTVDPANEKAVSFYKKAGFKVVKFKTDFYGRGEDRLVMKYESQSIMKK